MLAISLLKANKISETWEDWEKADMIRTTSTSIRPAMLLIRQLVKKNRLTLAHHQASSQALASLKRHRSLEERITMRARPPGSLTQAITLPLPRNLPSLLKAKVVSIRLIFKVEALGLRVLKTWVYMRQPWQIPTKLKLPWFKKKMDAEIIEYKLTDISLTFRIY